MRQVGRFEFPEHGNHKECDAWRPFLFRRALARRVLVVAQTRIEGSWSAYCDAVPGDCHAVEFQEVLRSGCKLLEDVARAMFPELDEVPYDM